MSNNIACIILAAGESKRLGSPKQLLTIDGETLINRTIELAIDNKLDPIIVVLGAYYQEVESQIKYKSKIRVINNQNWLEGQSTSLICGTDAISELNIPFIILLCDQPLLTKEIISGIIETYSSTKSDVVMLRTNGKRTPPVLLAPVCLAEIQKLTGDKGAREIVDKFNISYLENINTEIIADIDTKEDYNRLIFK